jgi:hypothetical protein
MMLMDDAERANGWWLLLMDARRLHGHMMDARRMHENKSRGKTVQHT